MCRATYSQVFSTRNNILVDHQINSYNDYMDNILPNILSQYFPLTINFNDKVSTIKSITLKIKNMNIESPYFTENNGSTKIITLI